MIYTNKDYGNFDEGCTIGNQRALAEFRYTVTTEEYCISWKATTEILNECSHFLYKKLRENSILYAHVTSIEKSKGIVRAGLMVRKDLSPDSDSLYISVSDEEVISVLEKSGREKQILEHAFPEIKGSTFELRIEAHSIRFLVAQKGGELTEIASFENKFGNGEYYLGLCMQTKYNERKAKISFTDTRLTIPADKGFIPYKDYIGSRLEILEVNRGIRKVVFESSLPLEAPNWSRDGKYFIVNAGGLLYKIPENGSSIEAIDTDFATSNNNDHGFSPDGRQFAISHHVDDRPAGEDSVIFTLPSTGGIPKQITENSPSYWHGWSPDGSHLIYTAQRNGQWGIYRITANGGKEECLTSGGGLDDGSEYSADGKFIWFNSNRSGTMEIWRMKADGSHPKQITIDRFQNWFPHESSDGKRLVYLAYPPEVGPQDHPYYKHVTLRLIRLENGEPMGKPEIIAHLYGGQGTINVHSWSPDGTKLAFVSNSDGLNKASNE